VGGDGGDEPPWRPQYSGKSGADEWERKEWERKVREKRADELKERAVKHGIKPEEYERQAADHLRKLLSEMVPFRRFNEKILTALLKGDRLRSLFETGTSSGANASARRASLENKFWGIPKNDRKIIRPAYGYLHPNTEGGLLEKALVDYGEVVVRFKRDILKRTTFTVGDSLDQITVPDAANLARKPPRHRMVAYPVNHPSWLAVPMPMGDVLDYPHAEALAQATLSTSPVLHYVEAQYHGEVTWADIESVTFLKKAPNEETRRLLKEKGIAYTEP
jgi:hypothetical protein